MSNLSQYQLQNLNESERSEILKFIESENAKSKVQMSIHNFTDLCFKKCNKNSSMNANLSNDDEQCLKNCVNRFLDLNIKIVQTLQQQ
ncbi:mitochondrial import inner membrane translocase subunit Tim8p [[Candida] jaroonii]|uniref:Mitochondrial import inner membrane translocase subunit Tim8p n=1 Tax=[Candida] jaroonii TaxID=467808 RepID=A0ACA9YCN7_9ASCO|nr:mitochondrial import inner membrane translocase subunit Tim8p [[Candida] jaroonii]